MQRRCDITGECEEPAVRRFRHTTFFGKPVTLWACRSCAKWWRTRHPDADGGDTPTPYDGEGPDAVE